MSGTTDTLLGFADATTGRTRTSTTREGSIAELHGALSERHLRAAREAVFAEHLPAVEERLLALLEELILAVNEPPENPTARRAQIAVYGERLSDRKRTRLKSRHAKISYAGFCFKKKKKL